MREECTKNEASYQQIFNEDIHRVAMERGDRRFSHQALKVLQSLLDSCSNNVFMEPQARDSLQIAFGS